MTDKKTKALKLALEANTALREWVNAVPMDTPLPAMPGIDGDWLDSVDATIREALAEQPAQKRPQNCGTSFCSCVECIMPAPPQQDPIVFYRCNGCGHAYEQVHPTSCDCREAGGFDRVEYYTSPPAQRETPRKPLTDEQIKTMWRCSKIYGTNQEKALALARAIEAAHGIKGGA